MEAATDLTLLVIDKPDFLFVFGEDGYGEGELFKKLMNLAEVRISKAYAVIFKNTILSDLSSSQMIHLEMLLREKHVRLLMYNRL